MILDLDNLEVEAKALSEAAMSLRLACSVFEHLSIQEGAKLAPKIDKCSKTILSLISELRETRKAMISFGRESDHYESLCEQVEQRLQSAEEALKFYSSGAQETEELFQHGYKARAHFEKFK